MAEEGHLPRRNNGRTKALAPMEHETSSEILPVEMMVDDFPLFPNLFIFTSLSLKFWLFFLCLDKLCSNNFQYPFKPKGAGTFSTTLNFMEEHSNYAIFYYYYKITTIRERTLRGLTTSLVCKLDKVYGPYTGKISTQVHKVDGPHEGSRF